MLKPHVCCCAGLLLVLALLLLSPALVAQQAPPQTQPAADNKPAAAKAKTADEVIEAALRSQVSLKFDGAPLAEVVKQLAKQHDINILLDERGLEETEIAPTTSIKFERETVRLATALDDLLGEIDCGWYIADEALHVTSRDAAKTKLVTRCYAVGDLVNVHRETDQWDVYESLSDFLPHIGSSTWGDAGGPGSSHVAADVLVVSQTWAMHEQVARLIEGLRHFRKLDVNLAPDKVPPPIDVTDPVSPELQRQLDQRIELRVDKTPLIDVVRLLQQRFKLPIRLDRKRLEEASVAESTEVSLRARNISLRSTLRQLGQLDLGFYCHDDQVVLTTVDACNERVSERLSWVGDMVADELGDDYDSLVELLTTTIAPTNWAEGNNIPIYEFRPSHAIIVSQTEEIHLQIEQLLKQMRQTRQENAKLLGPDKRTAEQKLVTHCYSLEKPRYTQMPNPAPADKQKDKPENKTAAQQPNVMLLEMAPPDYPIDPLIKWIQEETDAASWQVDGASIRLVANHLVIKQSPQVHHHIQKLLQPMGIQVKSQFGGGGGTGGVGGGGLFLNTRSH